MSAVDDTLLIDLDDQTIEVVVRRSETARTTRIQVGRDLPLRVVVPDGASDEFAQQAIRAKASWVRRRLAEMDAAETRSSDLGLQRDDVVWVFYEAFDVVRRPTRFARLVDGVLAVPVEGDAAGAVMRFYRREARRRIRQLVAEEADRTGLRPASVVVRDQRTRWGSCSQSQQLSLNWRLVIAPEEVARYVVTHELCHLRVANHAKPFWRLLAQHCPRWQEHAEWLRLHGEELRQYRVPRG